MNPMLTITQYATQHNLSRMQVYRLIQAGKLEAVKVPTWEALGHESEAIEKAGRGATLAGKKFIYLIKTER